MTTMANMGQVTPSPSRQRTTVSKLLNVGKSKLLLRTWTARLRKFRWQLDNRGCARMDIIQNGRGTSLEAECSRKKTLAQSVQKKNTQSLLKPWVCFFFLFYSDPKGVQWYLSVKSIFALNTISDALLLPFVRGEGGATEEMKGSRSEVDTIRLIVTNLPKWLNDLVLYIFRHL